MERRTITSRLSRLRLTALFTALLVIAGKGGALTTSDAFSSQDPAITPSFTDKQPIFPDEDISFTLSRPLAANEGRIAVFVGNTDVSSLLAPHDNVLVYSPRPVPLPIGESLVKIYLVDSTNTWREIAQFTLRVESLKAVTNDPAGPAVNPPNDAGASSIVGAPAPQTTRRHGLDKSTFTPAFTIGMKSQAAETHFPDANRPLRSTFADLTLQGGVSSNMTRGVFDSQTQFNIVGTSFRGEALRFGQERDNAPLVDLASYAMQFTIEKTKVTVGQLSFGSNRQLINGFSSRGISLTTPVSAHIDLSLAAMNGTSVVGWTNFFGVAKRDHQFVTGTAGFEFKPEHRGELRFELSMLDGRLQPLSSFNQGNITDVERSQGFGLRMAGADPTQRWRFDSGFTRSRFTNPGDPLLSQGFNLVAVRDASANASYFDGSFNLLQNARLSESKRATISLNYKYEQVDPLFKSVAAITQPDRLNNEIDVVGNIGDVTATFTHLRFHDNLGNVPSVLKSLSRRTALILGSPLSALLSNPAKPSPWLPRVSYSFDEVHQFGASIPVNGGFEVQGTVPDQISTNQTFSADWQIKTVRWGYRFNRSFQDNQQPGRELADLQNITNLWTVGMQPSTKFGFNLDIGFDSALNKEQKRTNHTLRAGPGFNWTMNKSMILVGTFSATRLADLANTSRNLNYEADVQWSYRFAFDRGKQRKVQTQFFIRYANHYFYSRDSVFGFANLTKLQTLNAGLNFTFF